MLPVGHVGVGFKPQHFEAIMAGPQAVGFFEVHAENYMGDGGPPHAQLGELRARYQLSLHGVGLSLGGPDRPDGDHLRRLKRLCDRYAPASFSEHLAWSSHAGAYLNDLLPLPYTRETLDHVVAHINEVQDSLCRPMLLENPATYMPFAESTMDEPRFITEVCGRAGCGLLLDVENIYVSAINHGLSPEALLNAYPLDKVGEIHLAGHEATVDAAGAPLLIDTHSAPVSPPVRSLYRRAIDLIGPAPTLIEWDNDVPSWPDLVAEARRAHHVMWRAARGHAEGYAA